MKAEQSIRRTCLLSACPAACTCPKTTSRFLSLQFCALLCKFGLLSRCVTAASATASPPAPTAAHTSEVAHQGAAPVLPFRVGYGFDLHRLVEGKKLVICGVDVPHVRGCDAHSDGMYAQPLYTVCCIQNMQLEVVATVALMQSNVEHQAMHHH